MFILQLSKPEFSLFLYESTAITSFNVLPTMAYGSFPIMDGKMWKVPAMNIQLKQAEHVGVAT